jgi:hypothetical protein
MIVCNACVLEIREPNPHKLAPSIHSSRSGPRNRHDLGSLAPAVRAPDPNTSSLRVMRQPARRATAVRAVLTGLEKGAVAAPAANSGDASSALHTQKRLITAGSATRLNQRPPAVGEGPSRTGSLGRRSDLRFEQQPDRHLGGEIFQFLRKRGSYTVG